MLFAGATLSLSAATCQGAAVPEAEANALSEAESDAQYTNLLASTVNAYATADGLLDYADNDDYVVVGGAAAAAVQPAVPLQPVAVPSITATQFHAQDEIGQYTYG